MATGSPGRLYKRGSVWWASCYISGVEIRRRGGTKRQAEKVLDELRRERATGRPHVALTDVLRAYRRELESRAKHNTRRTYDESVRALEGHFGPHFNVIDFTTQSILDFLEQRARTREPITANRPARNLRAALRRAVEDKVLKEMPCRIRVLREQRKKPHILTDVEFWKVWKATEHEAAKFALILAYHCGLRHDEIVHLRVNDILWTDTGAILAVRSHDGWTPKTHTERHIPLSKLAIEEIVNERFQTHAFCHLAPEKNVPLLYWGTREPRPYRDLYKQVRDGFRAAGLWNVEAKSGLHMCRRTFASRMLSAGHDLKTVQELGGWSTIEAVQRYLASTDGLKVAAVNSLSTTPWVESIDELDEM